jgi:LPXTG-site transpeptidase (sortase) family protein
MTSCHANGHAEQSEGVRVKAEKRILRFLEARRGSQAPAIRSLAHSKQVHGARSSAAWEAALFTAGAMLLTIYAWSRADAFVGSAADIRRFEEQMPDTTLWSSSRLRSYQTAAAAPRAEVVGVIEIPRVSLRAPIYPDIREVHLNRGVGLIPAMSVPGQMGNLGLAGHRDGFFRALKDVAIGEHIDVVTRDRQYRYQVVSTTIVKSDDVALLQRTGDPVITLVTCYPFYLVGHAPQRFIVRGQLLSVRERSAFARHHHQSSSGRET